MYISGKIIAILSIYGINTINSFKYTQTISSFIKSTLNELNGFLNSYYEKQVLSWRNTSAKFT
jgi:hypothetical protein